MTQDLTHTNLFLSWVFYVGHQTSSKKKFQRFAWNFRICLNSPYLFTIICFVKIVNTSFHKNWRACDNGVSPVSAFFVEPTLTLCWAVELISSGKESIFGENEVYFWWFSMVLDRFFKSKQILEILEIMKFWGSLIRYQKTLVIKRL